jgi:hypothetical protein
VAGEVFLNVLLARALEKRTGFRRIFVHHVTGKSGLGAGRGLSRHVKENLNRYVRQSGDFHSFALSR